MTEVFQRIDRLSRLHGILVGPACQIQERSGCIYDLQGHTRSSQESNSASAALQMCMASYHLCHKDLLGDPASWQCMWRYLQTCWTTFITMMKCMRSVLWKLYRHGRTTEAWQWVHVDNVGALMMIPWVVEMGGTVWKLCTVHLTLKSLRSQSPIFSL